MATKTCSKCGIEKDTSEFYKRKESNDGFRSYCKDCEKLSYYEWKLNNPEKAKLILRNAMRKYSKSEKGKSTIGRSVKKWRDNNKDKCLEYQREWYNKTLSDRRDNTMEEYFEKLKKLDAQTD